MEVKVAIAKMAKQETVTQNKKQKSKEPKVGFCLFSSHASPRGFPALHVMVMIAPKRPNATMENNLH